MSKVFNHQPRTGEISHKQWLYDRAGQLGIGKGALEMRIYRGKHPKPQIRAVNKRVLFVHLGSV